jgi:hypothetical protein
MIASRTYILEPFRWWWGLLSYLSTKKIRIPDMNEITGTSRDFRKLYPQNTPRSI